MDFNRFEFKGNAICKLLGIQFPVIQGGMVWCTDHALVTAVIECGGLGTLGAGSMYPSQLEENIIQVRNSIGDASFAVNLPLLYPSIEEHVSIIQAYRVPVVITSAGSPERYTARLKAEGIKVLHVVSSVKYALKAEAAGVDAVIAEGFEAGGHNGREEITTFCLTPSVAKAVSIPVIAAGGIANGAGMMAAMVLGAQGVQMGTRFLMSQECAAHPDYKQMLIALAEGETSVTLKELAPVRLVHNHFYRQIQKAYARGSGPIELKELLGKGRARQGMALGDLENGELEAGQVASQLDDLPTVGRIFANLRDEWEAVSKS